MQEANVLFTYVKADNVLILSNRILKMLPLMLSKPWLI